MSWISQKVNAWQSILILRLEDCWLRLSLPWRCELPLVVWLLIGGLFVGKIHPRLVDIGGGPLWCRRLVALLQVQGSCHTSEWWCRWRLGIRDNWEFGIVWQWGWLMVYVVRSGCFVRVRCGVRMNRLRLWVQRSRGMVSILTWRRFSDCLLLSDFQLLQNWIVVSGRAKISPCFLVQLLPFWV